MAVVEAAKEPALGDEGGTDEEVGEAESEEDLAEEVVGSQDQCRRCIHVLGSITEEVHHSPCSWRIEIVKGKRW